MCLLKTKVGRAEKFTSRYKGSIPLLTSSLFGSLEEPLLPQKEAPYEGYKCKLEGSKGKARVEIRNMT